MAYPSLFFTWLLITIFLLAFMYNAFQRIIYFGDTLDEPVYKELAESLNSEKKLYYILFFILLAAVVLFIFSVYMTISYI
jgi:hypothetical protein